MGGSLLLRLLNPFARPDPTVSDLVPHLWGIGALVVIVLTHSWAPTIAWCAAVIGSTASALGAVGLVREVLATTGAHRSRPSAPWWSLPCSCRPPSPPPTRRTTGGGPVPSSRSPGSWRSGWAPSLVGNFLVRTLGGERGGVP